MVSICGIDEAGRGPVIGPLVIAGAMMDEKDLPKLEKLGVKDSKLLTPKKREQLFPKIQKICAYKIIIIEPQEIDNAVQSQELNLNWLEAIKSAEILKELKPNKAILDCPSPNIAKYTAYVKNKLEDTSITVICEHKADVNHKIVGAASVLAKVTRDRIIEEIKKKYGELGSLPYEEKVWTTGNMIASKSIGEIVENKEAVNIFTLNRNNFRIEEKPITFGFKHKKMDIYRVYFNNGLEIDLSANHPVFMLSNDGDLISKPLYELEQGDRIAFSFIKKDDKDSIQYLDLYKLLRQYSNKKNSLYIRSKEIRNILKNLDIRKRKAITKKNRYNRTAFYQWLKSSAMPLHLIDEEIIGKCENAIITSKKYKEGIPLKLPLSAEFCWFLGLYLAEGWTSKRYIVDMANKDKEIREKIIRFSRKYNFGFNETKTSIRISSIVLNKIIKSLNLGADAYEKSIPNMFYNLSKKNIKSLLQGIYDGDGYNDGNAQEIEIYSKKLRDDIVNYELLIGNVCSIRYRKDKNSYIARRLSKSTNALSIDNIPSTIGPYIKKIRERYNLKLRQIEREYGVSRQTISLIENQRVATFSKKTLERINRIFLDRKLTKLLESDLYWLEVRKILNKESSETVYDLEVKPNNFQNFLGKGGIILHNSGYSADPITQKFLKENWEKHPEIFRKSWVSWQNHNNNKAQKKLGEF